MLYRFDDIVVNRATYRVHKAAAEVPFMFSGTSDVLVSASWVQRGFSALSDSIEAYNWSARGATHIPTPQAETIEVAIPWFRWKLLGDQAACRAFKALPMGSRWSVSKEQNPESCQ